METTIAEVRPQVYLVAWKELSGATVTPIEDRENGFIYSNSTLPDGILVSMKGITKSL